jgi:hypothetical protein
MARTSKQSFDGLSAREREVVGSPDDYAWDRATALPARPRRGTAQFSLRADHELVDVLQQIARSRGTSFSDIAREALEQYARTGGRPAMNNVVVSFPTNLGVLLQVEGRKAEVGANRRFVSPDEKTPVERSAVTF